MLGLGFIESVILIILFVPLVIMMAGMAALPLYIVFSLINESFSGRLYLRDRKAH